MYGANVVEIVFDSTKSRTKYFLLGSLGFSHSGTRGYHKSIQLFNIDIFTPQKSKHRYQKWPYFQPESHLFPRPTILGYLCQFFGDVCIYIYIYPYIIIYIYIITWDQRSTPNGPGPRTSLSPIHQITLWKHGAFPSVSIRVRTFPQQQGGTLLSVSYGTWIWAKYSDQPGQLLVHHVIVLGNFCRMPSKKGKGGAPTHTSCLDEKNQCDFALWVWCFFLESKGFNKRRRQ